MPASAGGVRRRARLLAETRRRCRFSLFIAQPTIRLLPRRAGKRFPHYRRRRLVSRTMKRGPSAPLITSPLLDIMGAADRHAQCHKTLF